MKVLSFSERFLKLANRHVDEEIDINPEGFRERINTIVDDLPDQDELDNEHYLNKIRPVILRHKQENSEYYRAAVKASRRYQISLSVAFQLLLHHIARTGNVPDELKDDAPDDLVVDHVSKEEDAIRKLVDEYGMTDPDARDYVNNFVINTGKLPPQLAKMKALRKVFKYASNGMIKKAAYG
jgi:antitoxin component of RelBE/YafQ-DinJ toxin-antitoxin module